MSLNMNQVYEFVFSNEEVFLSILKDVKLPVERKKELFQSKDWDELALESMDLWEQGQDLFVQAHKVATSSTSNKDDGEKVVTIQNYFITATSKDDAEEEEVLKMFRYVSRQGLVRTLWHENEMSKLDRIVELMKRAGRSNVVLHNVKESGDIYSGSLPALDAYLTHREQLLTCVPEVPPASAAKKEA